jgi:hypothetical protein
VIRAILISLVLMAGCAVNAPTTTRGPDTIIWSKGIAYGAPMWRAEAERWFDDPVLLVCHGGNIGTAWFMFPDHRGPMLVEHVAATLASVYPNRPIVLIVCNETGVRINVPGVFYATKIVQVWPAKNGPPPFFNVGGDVADGIEDFVTQ